MKCPIDSSLMSPVFDAVILGKYPATYFQCKECQLIQPSNPHWLPESYQSAIAASDVGLVLRNMGNIERLEPILGRLHPVSGKILDVGGGYGLLCRGLRDIGFDCYTTDLHCENLFAQGHEPSDNFECSTLLAFEVFEHIDNPVEFTSGLMSKYGAQRFIFSTLLHNGESPPPADWWYYAFETGQHISLYHELSIRKLAEVLGLYRYSPSESLHILSKTPITVSDRFLLDLRGRLGRRLHAMWTRYKRSGLSLTQQDYQEVKRRLRNKSKSTTLVGNNT